jgi:hypothetical protein
VYKERYSDPTLWQKEFDADICFWLKFNADWYEFVILSKDHMTIDMKSINWDLLRSLDIPAVNDAIDICHAKGMTNGWQSTMIGMKKWSPNSMPTSTSVVRQGHFIGFSKASPSSSHMSVLLKSLVSVRRILLIQASWWGVSA